MPYFYPGYTESRNKVQKYTDNQLLDLLDALYGRDNLEPNYTHEELLSEALQQHKEEWTDKKSSEYNQAQFWIKLNRAYRRNALPEQDGD